MLLALTHSRLGKGGKPRGNEGRILSQAEEGTEFLNTLSFFNYQIF